MHLRKFICYASLPVLTGFSSQSMRYPENLLLDMVNRAVTANLAKASTYELMDCKNLFDEKIKDKDGELRKYLNFNLGKRYIIYIIAGRSWNTFGFYYVGLSPAENQQFVFEHGDTHFRKKISLKKLNSLTKTMGSPSLYKYTFSPGMQDGACSWFTFSDGISVRSVILPPGGDISSPTGNPISELEAWSDTILPRE